MSLFTHPPDPPSRIPPPVTLGPSDLSLPIEIAGLPLSRFRAAGLLLTVRSRALGETIVFASDNAVLPADERRRVYRASELERLVAAGRLESA